MKAIIPVAGAGTKLRPHTYTQPKALIPLSRENNPEHYCRSAAGSRHKGFYFYRRLPWRKDTGLCTEKYRS